MARLCTDFVGLKQGKGSACDGIIKILCIEICGDGRHMGILECDDGNLNDGDGCSSMCVIEANYFCYGGNAFTPDTMQFNASTSICKNYLL